MDFDEEINLISSMYPEHLTIMEDSLHFKVEPNTEYGVHNLVECSIEITNKPKVKILERKGLDEDETL